MIYVASPYSHPDTTVQEQRFKDVRAFCAELMRKSVLCYSPIVHNHEINRVLQADPGFEFWMHHDLWMLHACKEMMVLCLPGWSESRGVAAEIAVAEEASYPVVYMEMD